MKLEPQERRPESFEALAEAGTHDHGEHEHAEREDEQDESLRFSTQGELPAVDESMPAPPQPTASERAFDRGRAAAGPAPLVSEQRRTIHGVTIIAPPGTSPLALDRAAAIVQQMLGRNEVAQEQLEAEHTTIVIIPGRTKMTDLAAFSSLRGKKTFDGRDWSGVRGSGGMRAPDGTFAIGVAEENLTTVRGVDSKYPTGYSIAMHEIAHTLHSKGMTDAQKQRVEALYQQQKQHDAADFSDSYAASNATEYFAQATNAFFGKNAGKDKNGKVNKNGKAWLKGADPDMYAFLVEMYETHHDAPQAAEVTPQPRVS